MSFTPPTSWDDTAPAPDLPRKKGMFEFIVKNGTTRRVMFITGVPAGVYRHSMFNYAKGIDPVLCTHENGIDKTQPCPICEEEKSKPPKENVFKVIDFGEVVFDEENQKEVCIPDEGKNGKTYQYQARKLFAKSGTEKYPGPMKDIIELRKRKGGGELVGMVMDCKRSGEKSARCGNSFTFVEMVPKAKIRDYLKSLGAGRNETDREKYLDNLISEPVWKDEFDIPTVSSLKALMRGGRPPSSGSGQSGRQSDGSSEDYAADDTIPF